MTDPIPAPTVALSSWTMTQETSPIDDLAEMVRMIRENSGKPPEPRYLDPHLRGIVCRFAYREQTRRLERIEKGERP